MLKVVILYIFFLPQIIFANLILWNSDQAIERLARSKYKADFYTLSVQFEPQANKLFCGVASSVIVLNSLRVNKKNDLPEAEGYIEKKHFANMSSGAQPRFLRYTQENVFRVKNTKTKDQVLGSPISLKGKDTKDFGFQLRQLASFLDSHGLAVHSKVVGEDFSIKTFRKDLKANLKKQNDYILVNFSRKDLGQKGGGHISPLGAYDEKSDSVLVMDVNPHKTPWFWVGVKELFLAMKTFDTVENRGYLLISD